MWDLTGDGSVIMDEAALRAKLYGLQQEHRDLDMAISALQASAAPDALQMQRMKKRKLALKDQMRWIEDQLFPDLIA
ncbi:MAG: YdcH family protein [Rhodothalassiaceae bacterium]